MLSMNINKQKNNISTIKKTQNDSKMYGIYCTLNESFMVFTCIITNKSYLDPQPTEYRHILHTYTFDIN